MSSTPVTIKKPFNQTKSRVLIPNSYLKFLQSRKALQRSTETKKQRPLALLANPPQGRSRRKKSTVAEKKTKTSWKRQIYLTTGRSKPHQNLRQARSGPRRSQKMRTFYFLPGRTTV